MPFGEAGDVEIEKTYRGKVPMTPASPRAGGAAFDEYSKRLMAAF